MSIESFKEHHPALTKVFAGVAMVGSIFGGSFAAAGVGLLTGSAALAVGVGAVTAIGGGALVAKLTS